MDNRTDPGAPTFITMKPLILPLALLLSAVSWARLGDSPAISEKRYGKPVAILPADPAMPDVSARTYRIEGLIITEEYIAGRCERLSLQKSDQGTFDGDELLEVAVINFPDSALTKAGASKRSGWIRTSERPILPSEERGIYVLTESGRVGLTTDKRGVIAVTNTYETARERNAQNERDAKARADSRSAREILKGL